MGLLVIILRDEVAAEQMNRIGVGGVGGRGGGGGGGAAWPWHRSYDCNLQYYENNVFRLTSRVFIFIV